MKELYIIRHGQTDFNKKGIIQGKGVDTSINDVGIRQSMDFFNYYKQISFDNIFTSSLKRTQETVLPFIKAGYQYEISSNLDEINWGIYEGKMADYRLKKEYNEIVAFWKNGEYDKSALNGESPIDLQTKHLNFIDELNQLRGNKILICTHGRAMRIFLCTLLKIPLNAMETFPHNNLSLYKLNQINGKYEMELFNDRKHLNG